MAKTVIYSTIATMVFAGMLNSQTSGADPTPLKVADVKHDGPVDFQQDILPILRRNCLACHNATDAESDLVLETPQTIIEGGAIGAGVVPGKSGESLVFQLAAHLEDPVMPPEDNEVGAKNLTPAQLGLIKLWIDQGAKGDVSGPGVPLSWQALPSTVNPVYSMAVSPHGKYVAAGRGNQVFVYSVETQKEVVRLNDPSLINRGIYDQPGVAHLDVVQSLAFSPDGKLLASGGYRTVKLWQRPENPQRAQLTGIEGEPQSLATSPNGQWAAVGQANGQVKLFELASGKVVKTLSAHAAAVTGVAFSSDSASLVTGSQDKTTKVFSVADGKELGKVETPAAINGVVFVLEDQQIATAGADHKLRTWHTPGSEAAQAAAVPAEGETAQEPMAIKEFNGHTGAITTLVATPNGKQLLSGSADATARLWDASGGNQLRQFAIGAPVSGVAVSSDSTKFAASTLGNMAKLFRMDNGQQLAEMRGDHRTRLAIENANRIVAVAKRHVDNAKKDLDAANKRKKSEEDNKKKSEENQKKTAETLKQKEEAAKKPVADKAAADQALAAVEPGFKTAEDAKKKTEEAAKVTAEAQKTAQAKRDAANKAAQDATNVLNAANTKAQQAADQAKAKPDDKALADASAAAQKAKAAADAAAKSSNEAKTKAEAEYNAAVQANQTATNAKNEAVKKYNEINGKYQQAMNKVKQTAAPAQKATDELNAAKRADEAALRSIQRATESVKKATEAVPVVQAQLKQREEELKQSEATKAEADKAPAASEKPVLAIAFTADGSQVATAGEDGKVHLWTAEKGTALSVFEGQGAAITALAATPAGGILAVAKNSSAIIWDARADWKLVRTIGSPDDGSSLVDRVTSLHFSPDGTQLATGGGEPSRSGELKIWKVGDGTLVREVKDAHSDTIFDLEFSPDGQHIASSAADRFMKVHETATGKFVRAFEGHTHHVMGVSWRADGRVLATSGADKAVKVWNFLTGDQTKSVTDYSKEVTSIKFVGTGEEMVTSAGDPRVRLRDTNGANKGDFGGVTDFVYVARVSANGKVYAAGGQEGTVRVWNAQRQPIATFAAPQPPEVAETVEQQASK